MSDLTAQYRAKNGEAKFEIFCQRENTLYGRVFLIDGNPKQTTWNLYLHNEHSNYFDLEPMPIDHGLKVDDLVLVWVDERYKEIRRFAKFVGDDLLCWADGESSKTPNARMEYWGTDWEKHEPVTREHITPTDDIWIKPCNAEMTKMAAEFGLGHWRCVSNKSNSWWQRLDGQEMDMNDYANYDELKTWMDVLRYFDNKYPMKTNLPDKPKWHEYLNQGYSVVCEVWDDGNTAPASVECIIGIDEIGKYVSGHEWDFAKPVPSECGRSCTGIKDGKTYLLPIQHLRH